MTNSLRNQYCVIQKSTRYVEIRTRQYKRVLTNVQLLTPAISLTLLSNTVHFKFNTFFSLKPLDSSLVWFKVYSLLFCWVLSDYALCIKCSLYHLRYFTVLLRVCSILIHFLCISLFTISSSVTIQFSLSLALFYCSASNLFYSHSLSLYFFVHY